MKILALDIASTAGVAFGRPCTAPISWTVSFAEPREHDARFAKALRFVRQMHKDLAPDIIAIEAPIGGKDANAFLIGLVAVIRGQAKELGITTVQYAAGSVRKHFLGKALTSRDFPHMTKARAKLAIKEAVLTRCRALGWNPATLDAADACALFDFACSRESRAHQMTALPGMFEGVRHE